MRSALAALALLAACTTPSGTQAEVCDGSWRDVASVIVSPASGGERQAVAIRCIRPVDENRVRIGFEMPPGPDCYELAAIDVVEAAHAVSIALFVSRVDDPAAGACPMEDRRTATEVDLQAPVAGRELLDGSRSD